VWSGLAEARMARCGPSARVPDASVPNHEGAARRSTRSLDEAKRNPGRVADNSERSRRATRPHPDYAAAASGLRLAWSQAYAAARKVSGGRWRSASSTSMPTMRPSAS
jgi:hypothetical protein